MGQIANQTPIELDNSGIGRMNTLEHLNFSIDIYLDVTELGIEKLHEFELAKEDVSRVVDKVVERLKPLTMVK